MVTIADTIEVKGADMREGGVKSPGKMPTLFMDDP